MNLNFFVLELWHYKDIYQANKGNVATYFFDFHSISEAKGWIERTLVEISNGEKLEFVVYDNNTFVWMVALRLYSEEISEISLWVVEEYQRKWYWKKMIEFIVWKAKKLNLKEVRYQVSQDNASSVALIQSIWFDRTKELVSDEVIYYIVLQ